MYSKPEVTQFASSIEAIQHPHTKVQPVQADSPEELITTANAYAADE
jgi:hypothetical protein